MDTALHYALEYAKLGWHVFPCQTNKKPMVGMSWTEESTTDINKIKAWSQQYPKCWWGVDCKKSNLFILDSDVKGDMCIGESSLATLEANNRDHVPATYTVGTPSGGSHRYFIGQGKTSSGQLGKGLDVRSDGGYVIAPNNKYVVTSNGTKVEVLPRWLLNAAGKRRDKSSKAGEIIVEAEVEDIIAASAWLATKAPACVEGTRDTTTFKVAATLRSDYALSYSQSFTALKEIWLPRGDNVLGTWSEIDILAKLNSVYGGNTNKGQGEGHIKAAFDALPGYTSPTPQNDNDFDPRMDIALPLSDLDIDNTPKRNWLMKRWYIMKYVTVTIAPGGVGKSNLTNLEALAVASGKNLTGETVLESGAVWVYNTEDPLDELRARFAAACKFHKLDPKTLDNLYITSGRNNPMCLVYENGRSLVVNEVYVQYIIDTIRAKKIKLLIVDPFVKAHAVNENDNMAIDKVVLQFARIGEATGCAISLVHHTRKMGKEGNVGNIDTARGASSLANAARIGRTLNTLTDKDAEELILHHSPSWYVRLDDAKANMSPPDETTIFFEKISVTLDNGDKIGTLARTSLSKRNTDHDNAWVYEAVANIVHQNGDMSLNNLASTIASLGGENKREMTKYSAKKLIETLFTTPYYSDEKNRSYEITGIQVNGRPTQGMVEREN